MTTNVMKKQKELFRVLIRTMYSLLWLLVPERKIEERCYTRGHGKNV
jgi:hypothetical protein